MSPSWNSCCYAAMATITHSTDHQKLRSTFTAYGKIFEILKVRASAVWRNQGFCAKRTVTIVSILAVNIGENLHTPQWICASHTVGTCLPRDVTA